METCKTIKIKASASEQGDYVLINESDFDEKKHKLYIEEKPLTVAEIKEQLIELGVDFPANANKQELADILAAVTE